MAGRDFLLPDLGEGLEEAEVVTWRVAEGDRVELNQPLVEVNTAKALVEIPSPWEGVVTKLHAGEGEVVEVGRPLVTIEVGDAAASTAEAEAGSTETAEAGEGSPEAMAVAGSPAEAAQEGVQQAQEAPPRRRAVLVGYGVAEDEEPQERSTAPTAGTAEARRGPVAASPPVRRMAKQLGVDLASIEGTGRDGRVTREDVERAAAGGDGAETAAPGDGAAGDGAPGDGAAGPARRRRAKSAEPRRIPVRGTRRLIAEKMARSAREIPHVTTFLTVDAHWLEAFRTEIAGDTGERVSALPIVVRALAEVAAAHPKLNASFDADASEMVLYPDLHAGIAVDTRNGLLVAVVRDVAAKGIREIGDEIGALARAAREGTIRTEQMAGGTITLTNVGSFGAEYGTPIINHPEGAILATGVIEPRALVVDGEVVARPAMTLSLSFDHRLLDGAEAGRALKDLAELLESPFRLGSLPR
jgi:2-oxoisovalerate dehydrogenase E2 component (dihydrolipoyl transacylase)